MTGSVVDWVGGFWTFYRQYTTTAVHTAAAACLAIFGLLVFIDPLFAVLAIAAYVLPPVVLYARNADHQSQRADRHPSKTEPLNNRGGSGDRDTDWSSGETDQHDGDTDRDGTDTDGDDGDTDRDT